MLYTHDFEKKILYNPSRLDSESCDNLLIVTGFTDCEMIAQHLIQLHDEQGEKYVRKINIDIILGMYKGSGLTERKHRNIMQTLNRINSISRNTIHTTCRYIYRNEEVHSKVYVWRRAGQPILGFAGSANYTINAFRIRREAMADCPGKDASDYYAQLFQDSIDCFDGNVRNVLKFSNASVPDDELSPDNIENLTYDGLKARTPLDVLEVSWLTKDNKVGKSSGPNWGFRGEIGYFDLNGEYVRYNRNPNQAYLPYNNRKQGFFPDRKNPEDKNCPLFKVVTKDDGIFYMRMAQQNNKALHTAESNAILGAWLRKRLRVPDGSPVTMDDFKRYGKTAVTFYKYADDVYIMDF